MSLPVGTSGIEGAGDNLMTVAETAKYMNVPIDTVYAILQNRRLSGKKIGRAWRISRQEVDAYVQNQAYSPRISLQVQDILWQHLVQRTLDITTKPGDIRQDHKNPDFIITDQPIHTLGLQDFSGRVITLVGATDSAAVRENMNLPGVFCTFMLRRHLTEDPRILRNILSLPA